MVPNKNFNSPLEHYQGASWLILFGSVLHLLKGRDHFSDPLFLWYQCVPLTLLCLRNYRDFRIRPFFTLYSLFKSGGCREYLLLGWCTTLVASFGKHIYLFLFVCPILIHIEKMCINMVSLEKFLLILCGVYLLIH